MSAQAQLELSRRLGDEGIRASTARAEADDPGLTDVMFAFLVKFAQAAKRRDRFTSEVITIAYAQDVGFNQPGDMRSWGGVFQRATHRGVLEVADYNGTRTLGHGVKGAKRYRSLVCGQRWTDLVARVL
jgi:hypothetical protein